MVASTAFYCWFLYVIFCYFNSPLVGYLIENASWPVFFGPAICFPNLNKVPALHWYSVVISSIHFQVFHCLFSFNSLSFTSCVFFLVVCATTFFVFGFFCQKKLTWFVCLFDWFPSWLSQYTFHYPPLLLQSFMHSHLWLFWRPPNPLVYLCSKLVLVYSYNIFLAWHIVLSWQEVVSEDGPYLLLMSYQSSWRELPVSQLSPWR